MNRGLLRLAHAGLLILLTATPLAAQDWPSKPIRVITPLAPGGAADLLVRTVGEQLTANTGQPVVIENRPGGGGGLAGEIVARATPDGYTLLLGSPQPLHMAPLLTKNIKYDPVKDFTPIATSVVLPICLVVHKSVPVNSVKELIAYAKANPGKLSFGSSGTHTSHHIAGEYLKAAAGIDMVHIPYRGGNPAMTDLLSGQIPVLIATLSTTLQYIEQGNLKVLAVVEATRSRSQPDIPTIGETIPGFAMPISWLGFVAPAGLPKDLQKKVQAEFNKASDAPKVQEALLRSGFEMMILRSPDEVADLIKSGMERYRKIAAEAQLKAE